jgi:hypothetical protein
MNYFSGRQKIVWSLCEDLDITDDQYASLPKKHDYWILKFQPIE